MEEKKKYKLGDWSGLSSDYPLTTQSIRGIPLVLNIDTPLVLYINIPLVLFNAIALAFFMNTARDLKKLKKDNYLLILKSWKILILKPSKLVLE